MKFQEIAKQFAASAPGTDAFKRLYQDAFQLMTEDKVHAGLYFVIGIAAQAYVRQYEDQAVSLESAARAHETLIGFNDKIVRALTAEPAEKLSLLSEVAIDYQHHNASF